MRTVYLAIAILALVIIMIVCNSVYVIARVDELLALCQAIENGSAADAVESLTAKWLSCRRIIALSIHRSEIERIDGAVVALRAYAEFPADFYSQLETLKMTLHRVADAQRFSPDSIF